MISNLQQKLAAISKDMKSNSVDEKPKTELDLTCSVFEQSYNYNHLIGDFTLGDICSRDVNSLNSICFSQSYESINLDDIVFFDTETTGLAGGTSTAAFLIGTGYFDGGKFVTKQFLMNDYYQESDMIKSLNYILSNHKAVVSYNGKAYDRHIVNTRSILNRLPRLLDDKIQLDLLHSARRLYKRRLKSCSMHSIEENILNLKRIDDIPGSEIPEIFFNYIKYKESSMLNKVIEHNLQDIVSMIAIADRLLDAYDNPLSLNSRDDIFSQGQIYEKLGFPQKAKLCYNVLGNYPPALAKLGAIAKAESDYKSAISSFESLSRMQRFDAFADIELAKLYEHKLKDIDKAIEHTKRAMEKVCFFMSDDNEEKVNEIKKRKLRLDNKLIVTRKEQ